MANLSRKEKTENFVELIMKQGVMSELEALLETNENDELRTAVEVQEELENLLDDKEPKEALIHLINSMSSDRFKAYEDMFIN